MSLYNNFITLHNLYNDSKMIDIYLLYADKGERKFQATQQWKITIYRIVQKKQNYSRSFIILYVNKLP